MASNEDSEDSPAPESKAQRDARLRRERRNAKILAGGSERLNKITSLSGRPAAAEAELQKTRTPSPATSQKQGTQESQTSANNEDPAEVDISNMFQKPQDQQGQPGLQNQEEMLRRMLRAPENGQEADQQGTPEDPMMQMMQQMLSPSGEQPPGSRDFPPGLASMFGGAQREEPQEQSANSADYIWRVVHAIFSLVLGTYAASAFAFTGSKLARHAYVDEQLAPRLFWIFATAELTLQSTRYFVDKGRLPPSSVLGKIASFLPHPYAHYLRVLSRYSIIYTTVVSDAMVVVFILGAMAWWKGLADA